MKLFGLERYFDDAAIRRGEEYRRDGHVTLTGGDDDSATAQVVGGRTYSVHLRRERNVVVGSCDCPYFTSFLAGCKHLWAVLVAARNEKLLGLTPENSGKQFTFMEDIEAFDREEEGEPEDRDRTPKILSFPRVVDASRQVSKADNWRMLLPEPACTAHPIEAAARHWPANRRIVYLLDVPEVLQFGQICVTAVTVAVRQDGRRGAFQPLRLSHSQLDGLPNEEDRSLLSAMFGAEQDIGFTERSRPCVFRLSEGQALRQFPVLCATGKFFLNRGHRYDVGVDPVRYDDGSLWGLKIEVTADSAGKGYLVQGALVRGDERRLLAEPVALTRGGWVVWADSVIARFDHFGSFSWVEALRRRQVVCVPKSDGDVLVQRLVSGAAIPILNLPEELRFETVQCPMKPHLRISRFGDSHMWDGEPEFGVVLGFEYDGVVVRSGLPGSVYDPVVRRVIVRDIEAERKALAALATLRFRRVSYEEGNISFMLSPRHFSTALLALVSEKWHIEVEGRLYRQPGAFHLHVSSGIDWFELRGRCEYGGASASLSRVLDALRRKEHSVVLDDGSLGMLPEDWLVRYGALMSAGTPQGDGVRFGAHQAGILDALLAAEPEGSCDEAFRRIREQLHGFEAIQPEMEPPDFVGVLRPYQREGLGWLRFLQGFHFGGCLADDMGLGKTIQTLALLESRRAMREQGRGDCSGPSLVVAPRSLIFNWKLEAERFTPKLCVLDHTGTGRSAPGEHFSGYDVVLTTYGTLRRDILALKEVRFDYVVLDESQAIKNAATATAKCARLLRGRFRLALSGTPIENHLGELWSLFEFLNPGMLGKASALRTASSGDGVPDAVARALLARALRPFILRRTKAQVARDLPAKVEKTIYCPLVGKQRKLYDELLAHYRQSLLPEVEKSGIGRSKIRILEALLRLRQVACHHGLIDASFADELGAKFESLLPQIEELVEEDHKALVFSQFTSYLAILRRHLDKTGIVYEYLDGKTTNRQRRVERFQSDPSCKLFLISLKAGGLGLNLTAAEYVFLLDPWWNPAVEAQAIDRAHRIGQMRSVFAYRLIAQSTVEEKVLELQKGKRELADAIISADNSLIRDLKREDLELLLS